MATREACIELLRAAGELRTLSESIRNYRGNADGMRTRIDEARSRAESTRLSAASVSMQAPELAESAYQVASAATDLIHDVQEGIDVNQGVPVGEWDVGRIVDCTRGFRDAAVKHTGG